LSSSKACSLASRPASWKDASTRVEATRKLSSTEVWPSLSRSAAGSATVSDSTSPRRVAFCSWPVLVAVTITRSGPAKALRKGALAGAVSMNTKGRRRA
jgi:hypothetical protein